MKNIIPIILVIAFIVYCSCYSVIGIYNHDLKLYYGKWDESRLIDARYSISTEPSVLYLDVGDAPYFFRANSSCRYISPLILARHRDYRNLSRVPEYQELSACIRSYQGKYIVMEVNDSAGEDWFGENQRVRKPIMDIIHSNYSLIYDGTWRVWRRQ